MLYEPVPLIRLKPFHGLYELGVSGPADGLHLHGVVAVWVPYRNRSVGNVSREHLRNEENSLRKITRQTVSDPRQRRHFCHGFIVAQTISKGHQSPVLYVILG